MKVIHQSADRLVLEEKSSLIRKALKPLIVFSFVGLAASAFTFLILKRQSYTEQYTTLTCSRPENYVDCKLEQKDAKGKQTINRNIHKVKKAIVREEQATRSKCTGSGENRSCRDVRYQICHIRLVGETTTTEIPNITALAPTTETGCNSTNANATAQNINNLISGKTTAPLTWSKDTTKGDLVSEMSNMIGQLGGGWPIKLAIGVSLIGYGIYLFNVSHSIWTFDKKTGKLIQNCQKLWNQTIQEYLLSHIAGISYKITNSKTSNCNFFLWYREGENLRHAKLYLAKGERITQAYGLLETVRPFCDKDYQIIEWNGDYAYGERTPRFLKLYLQKSVFLISSHYQSTICADKKQDTLTVQWNKTTSIVYRCVLSQVTQIQVHKQELKDSDGDIYTMYKVFLDLNSETVNLPMYENPHAGSLILQPMQFLGEFLDVPVKEVETT